MNNVDWPQRITIGILLVLTVINALWVFGAEKSGPLIAAIFYAVVTFLCWQRNHFQAGILAGFFGLAIHIYELISLGLGKLDRIELAFFGMNIVLPVLLIIFSYKAHQESNWKV